MIVPIYRSDAERAACLEAAGRVKRQLVAGGVRVKLDERDGRHAGLQVQRLGDARRAAPHRDRPARRREALGRLARRDTPGKAGKSFVPEDGLTGCGDGHAGSIQTALYERAQAFMRANTAEPRTYDEFKQAIEAGGFCRVWWSGDAEREAAIKEETKATIRCIPLEQPGGEGVCIGTGRPARQVAIFGRAY